MKKYTFTIEVEEVVKADSLIDNLIAECNEEERQLALTHAINMATRQMHEKVLADFVDKANESLIKLGLKFASPKPTTSEKVINRYYGHVAKMNVNNKTLNVGIMANADRNFKDSKYSTCTGEYDLKIGWRDSNTCFEWTNLHISITSVDDIIKFAEQSLKKHIKGLQL